MNTYIFLEKIALPAAFLERVSYKLRLLEATETNHHHYCIIIVSGKKYNNQPMNDDFRLLAETSPSSAPILVPLSFIYFANPFYPPF